MTSFIHTDADLDLGGLTVPAGDYTLYVDLTTPDQWTLIVNKKSGQWGLSYDKTADLGRVKMKMSKPASDSLTVRLTFLPAFFNCSGLLAGRHSLPLSSTMPQ